MVGEASLWCVCRTSAHYNKRFHEEFAKYNAMRRTGRFLALQKALSHRSSCIIKRVMASFSTEVKMCFKKQIHQPRYACMQFDLVKTHFDLGWEECQYALNNVATVMRHSCMDSWEPLPSPHVEKFNEFHVAHVAILHQSPVNNISSNFLNNAATVMRHSFLDSWEVLPSPHFNSLNTCLIYSSCSPSEHKWANTL